MPRANDRIGPYKLIRKLGKGAFGEVWLARDVDNLVAVPDVALKLPLDDDVDLDAIRQEAKVWIAASGHPNVLPMLEARIYGEQVLIASEYAPDGSLKDWLKTHGGKAPSVEAALAMTRQILTGLGHLHERKIIHRDLKPDNILLNGTTPRIADFGISRVLKSTSMSAVMAGTPVYMAPEAFRRKRNEQTDLWSVGVILYQLLSGRLPFLGQDLAEVMFSITQEEPAPLAINVPAWAAQALATALAKNPEARFKTAEQMRAALSAPPERIIVPPALGLAPVYVEFTWPPRSLDVKQKTAAALAPRIVEDLNGVPLEMILVPGGKFKMGSPAGQGYKDEWPQHEVTVPSFYCGKFPVTQAQWQAVMGDNPAYFRGADLPVESISWQEAKVFCQKLIKSNGKPFRLPSEAEWEYACRAGTTEAYAGDLSKLGWCDENSQGETHPVGQKQPNAFGLYDMHGNVWEWCEDVWHESYWGAPLDGSAWLDGGDLIYRVLRGGSCTYHSEDCRSAFRLNEMTSYYHYDLGFRVVVLANTG